MKQLIKIGLILIALAAIGCLLWFTMRGMTSADDTLIKKVPYYDQVEERVKAEINDKVGYDKAETAYHQLVGEIQTMAMQNGVKKEESESCLKIAASAFAPVLNRKALDYFNGDSWDGTMVNKFLTSAKALEASGSIKGGGVYDDLMKVINTGTSYNEAVALCNGAGCTTVAGVQSAIAKAQSYQKNELLQNDKALMSKLSGVPGTAKATYNQHVKSHCAGVASRWRSYGSYSAWKSAYNSAVSMASNNPYDDGSSSGLISQLNSADSNAYNYYNGGGVSDPYGGSSSDDYDYTY